MRAQRLSALAVGALAALGTVPFAAVSAHAAATSAAASADPATELVIDSAATNTLFHGVSGVWGPPAQIFSSGGGPSSFGFTIAGIPNIGNLTASLAAPSGQTLTPGVTYSGSDTPAPSISFSTGSGTCGAAGSRFTVHEYTLTASAVDIEIEFWANCGAPLHGLYRYNATAAVPAGAPTGAPITGVPGVPVGTVGPISFKRGGALIANSGAGVDGSVVAQVAGLDSQNVLQTWSPLGSRMFVFNDRSLSSVRPDGGAPIRVAGAPTNGTPVEAAVSPDGSTVVYAAGYVYASPTDGSAANAIDSRILVPAPGGGPSGSTPYLHPRFMRDGSLLLTGTDNAYQHPSLYRFANGAVTRLVADANWGTPSPDGTRIAFVRADSSGVNQLFVVGADGSSGLTQLTHGPDDISEPSWSPDGKVLAYSDNAFHEVVEINAAGGAPVGSIPNATSPVWTPPIIDSHVIREWGADRVGTAVAASQMNFANHGDTADSRRGQAGAVVLARDDNFADALGGSALAVRKNAPLLITAPNALDPQVKKEIGRVLAPGGSVYLLGGTAALSPAVASALSGYHVVRLAGDTRYGTAVAIAKQVNPNPRTVMVATGDLYPDALAAGAVGEPVLLTSGKVMPKETAAYLNTLNPDASAADGTQIVTIGGPGDDALKAAFTHGQLPSWPSRVSRLPLTGTDRYATALLVAQTFFTSNVDVAVATGASWPDALSGGAMVGHRGGPLLLTDPAGISPAMLDYLRSQSASLFALHLLGGPAALPNSIAQQAAGVIGLPGHVRIDGFTAGGVYPYVGKAAGAAAQHGAQSAHASTMTRQG